MSEPFHILAFYLFTKIQDPKAEVIKHKEFLVDRNIFGRIYLSEQGINGSISAPFDEAKNYQDWLKSQPLFNEIEFKTHYYPEHAFPKMTVKYRKELVALGMTPDLSQRGEYLNPKAWRKTLEEEENILLLDVRNEYEWKIGHFEGARLPACQSFREFCDYADNLKKEVKSRETKVLMYCTGGIRCELYSAVLKERGFDNVFQLHGGVIQYGQDEGNAHWKGKLFVFDDRLTTAICEEPAPVIGRCRFCGIPNETYYNCANVDCNDLFLCCPNCIEEFLGCCKPSCSKSPRIRPYQQQGPHKPFRRWYTYSDTKE